MEHHTENDSIANNTDRKMKKGARTSSFAPVTNLAGIYPPGYSALGASDSLKGWDELVDSMFDECPYLVEYNDGYGDLDWDSSGQGKDALAYFMNRDLSASPSSLFELLLFCAVVSNHESRRFDEKEFPGYGAAVQRDAWNILTSNGLSGNIAYHLIESASEYGRKCYWDGNNPHGKRAALRTAFIAPRN